MKQLNPFYGFLFSLCIFYLSTGSSLATPLNVSDTELRDKLENEFTGAYPEQQLATGQVKEFEIDASENNWAIIPPYQTAVWSYNGNKPGPVIRIKSGDTLKLKFTNNLPQPTTIHWHGVRVPNAMDGVPGVTQPPIQPGKSFTYQFTPKDAGTFWFHPHVNAVEQIERGLHGVLIVEDPNEPEYSQEFVWILDDWLLEETGQINSDFMTRHDLAHDGRWGNVITVNGQYQPAFKVKAGERIRIRMINVANARVFALLFEQLTPYVIAVDGMLTGEPFPPKRFFIAPGNRVDLDITIPQSAAGKTLSVQDVLRRQTETLSFLEVDAEKSVATPSFKFPQAKHFPQWIGAIKTTVDHEFILNAKRGGAYDISWMIDGKVWPERSVNELTAGRFTHLRFNNQSARIHPMHLHGQFFKVIAKDGKVVEENYWRDTILIGPKESVDIGLIPLDKGLWANHCHILEHAEAGMMTTFKVK